MKLEDLTLQIRPRTPWEAMDLAVRLVMTHWSVLAAGWMVTVFPLFVIINLVLLNEHPIWAFALVWFLKPLYDRIPLFVLSRVIFSQETSYRDVLNALPQLLKTGILSSLTLYRLDPGRSFSLPVRQLENLNGKRRRDRMQILQRGNNREVIFFILCFHLETLISWGLISLLLMLLPVNIALQGAEEIFINEEPGLLINALSMLFYFFTLMLVETLYVAGGFVLYLNRRIILEGWDIELVFKKLTQRQAQISSQLHSSQLNSSHLHSSIIIPAVMVLFLFSSNFTEPLYAAQHNASSAYNKILPPIAQPPLAAADSKRMINEVMSEPLFSRFKQVEELKYIGDKAKEDNKLGDHIWIKDIMESIGSTLALIFEIILWIAVFTGIYLLIKNRHRLQFGFSRKKKVIIETPKTLFGLDLSEESLPDNVAQQALALYQQAHYREAMALLYRAALANLVQRYQFDLKKGATEGDCMKLVTRILPLSAKGEGRFFVDLTRSWQQTAYAHKNVSEEKMQQLCRNWSLFYKTENNKTDEQST